ncbi:MAG TPA: YihY/virulence factor BrkB family protein [bacterium]|nr:YihY/virulence factor BrkB family protein [bacterium]
MKEHLRRLIEYFSHDIWRIQTHKLPPTRSFFLRQLRIVVLAFQGFDRNKCKLRASALTFYTLLSIVPILAMAFGVAKGFGFEKILDTQIRQNLAQYPEVTDRIILFANALLENTKGGLIAGVGIALLIWTIIKVLGSIEESFNDIWGIRQGRSITRRFSDYLAIMFICPLLLIMSSSVTIFIATQLERIAAKLMLPGQVQDILVFTLKSSPYVMIWVLFVFLYVFLPNTRVRFSSGLIAGLVAGTLYQIIQWVYITFQVGVARYNAIYGSFAALPLFLVWLQVSWRIVLFGAEISFAHQNVETYEFEPDCLSASRSYKNFLAVAIVHRCVRRFVEGLQPLTAREITRCLDMPIRLVRELLYELVRGGILSEVTPPLTGEEAYQPGRDVSTLSVASVLGGMDDRGTRNIPVIKTEELQKLEKAFEAMKAALMKAPENVLLKDIVE